MRVVNASERAEIDLQDILIVTIDEKPNISIVATGEGFHNLLGFGLGLGINFRLLARFLFRGGFAELFLQILKTQAFLPELLCFVKSLGIRHFVTVDQDPLIGIKLEMLGFQKILGVSDTLL